MEQLNGQCHFSLTDHTFILRIKLTLYRFTNGDDLIAAHQSECMDFIFLDIIMPLLNGIDAAREFVVDSYEVKAFNMPKTFFTAKTADGFCRIVIADVDYL